METMPSIVHQTALSTASGPPSQATPCGTKWYRATPRIRPATKLIAKWMRVWVMRMAEGSQPPNREAATMAAA